jgi:hypothetical protein
MIKHSPITKALAVVLVFSLQAVFIPVSAGDGASALSGTLLSSERQAPLANAKIHVADPKTGEIYSSHATGANGEFVVPDLPAAVFEIAVESEGGLYLVETPVSLAPGQTRTVNVAINDEKAPSPGDAKRKGSPPSGIWNNPLTASLVVISSAVILGWILKEATDESVSSPSETQ